MYVVLTYFATLIRYLTTYYFVPIRCDTYENAKANLIVLGFFPTTCKSVYYLLFDGANIVSINHTNQLLKTIVVNTNHKY